MSRQPTSPGEQTPPGSERPIPDRPPHVIIRASAGTGKTFQLSNRYLHLILTGHAPERILATTFTRKAAGEILSRIVFRLAAAAEGPAPAAQLGAEIGLPDLTLSACRRSLQQLTRHLHRLRVSTLDSFFLQATQTLSLELGLPPQWQIIEEAEERRLRETAIAAMLTQDDSTILLQLLHWLAKGETNRGVSRLLLDTVNAMYELYLESPPHAWRRIARLKGASADSLERVRDELRGWLNNADVDRRLQTAVEGLLEQLQQEDWEGMAEKGISKKLIEGDLNYYGKELPAALVQTLQPLVEQVRAVIQNRFAMQTEASFEVLHRFHTHYEALKHDRRALRFGDLARYLGRLEDASHRSRLSFRLDATIEGLLLDEFQDTSLDQWRVIRPFAQHASGEDSSRSFLCVGDLKQAIYGWRGGNAELLDAVATELSNLTDQSLDRSFRSAPAVIDVVNRINQRMDRHDGLERCQTAVRAWVKRFPEHSTSREELPGYVSLETTEFAPATAEQRTLAIQRAADRVAELRAAAPQLSVAILVRTNELVGRARFELQKRGVLASEEGGTPLTDSAAVQLVISLLTLADYPQDTAARFHLASSPWAQTLGLSNHRDPAAAERLSHRVRLALADHGYGDLLNRCMAQLRPFTNAREWRRLEQLVELGYRYQQQIETPRDVGYHRQHSLPIATADFVERIAQQRVADPSEDPVRVMNVHQSKGLQFDVVILPDLDRRLEPQTPMYAVDRSSATEPLETVVRYAGQKYRPLLPASIQRVHERDQTLRTREELCVLYVALTRAVHSLQMIIAPSRPAPSASGKRKSRDTAGDKKLPKTVAGLIRASLTGSEPLEPDQQVFQWGDPDWLQRIPMRGERGGGERRVALPPVALRAENVDRSEEAPRGVRPSQLEGDGRVRLADRWDLSGQTAMRRGTLIHAFFELVEWSDAGVPDRKELRSIGLQLDADPTLLEEAVEAFEQMLGRPAIQAALSRQRYQAWCSPGGGPPGTLQLDVRREQRLTVRVENDWLSGSIDRLVLLTRDGVPVAAEILDFKTDAVTSSAELRERTDFYRPQLLAYRRGASQMLRLDLERIATSLLFVSRGQLVPLSSVKW